MLGRLPWRRGSLVTEIEDQPAEPAGAGRPAGQDLEVAIARDLLEQALGNALSSYTWERMRRVAIITGSMILLWSKALALQNCSPESQAEWDWWVEQLARSPAAGWHNRDTQPSLPG